MAANDFREQLRHHLRQTRAGLFGQFEHAWNFSQGVERDPKFLIAPQQSITFSGKLTDEFDGTPVTLKVTNDLTGPSGEGFQCQTGDPLSGTIVVGASPSKGQATLEFDAPSDEGPEPPATSTLCYAAGNPTPGPRRWEAVQLDWSVADPRIFQRNALIRRPAELHRSFAGNYFALDAAGSANIFPVHMLSFDANNILRWSYTGDFQEQGLGVQHDALNDVACFYGRIATGTDASRLVGIDDAAAALSGDGNAAELWSITFGNRRLMDIKANNNGHVYVLLQIPHNGKDLFKINTLTGAIDASYLTAKTGNADGGRIAIGPSGEVVTSSNRLITPDDGGSALQLPSDIFKFDADLILVARRAIDWATVIGVFSRSRPVAVANDGTIYASHGTVFTQPVLPDEPLIMFGFSSDLSSVLAGLGPMTVSATGTCEEMVELNGELFLGGSSASKSFPTGPAAIFRVDPVSALLTDTFFPAMTRIRTMNGIEGSNIFLASSEGNKATLFTQEPSSTPPGRIPCIAAVKYAAGNITDIYFNSVEVEFNVAEWSAEHSVEGDIPVGNSSATPQWEYHTPL